MNGTTDPMIKLLVTFGLWLFSTSLFLFSYVKFTNGQMSIEKLNGGSYFLSSINLPTCPYCIWPITTAPNKYGIVYIACVVLWIAQYQDIHITASVNLILNTYSLHELIICLMAFIHEIRQNTNLRSKNIIFSDFLYDEVGRKKVKDVCALNFFLIPSHYPNSFLEMSRLLCYSIVHALEMWPEKWLQQT